MPDPRGERPSWRWCRLVPGADPDAGQLEQFSRDRLAPYKVPKRWVFAESLPMTASGKVQKHLVLRRAAIEVWELARAVTTHPLTRERVR